MSAIGAIESAIGAIDCFSEFFCACGAGRIHNIRKFHNCVLHNKILHELRLCLKYKKRYCYWFGYVGRKKKEEKKKHTKIIKNINRKGAKNKQKKWLV